MITNSPAEPWTKQPDEALKSNPGNYCLSGAYGGWKLERICNDGGGVTDITSGYVPKRELYNQIQAYIAGIQSK